MIVLGIETSCDECSASVVKDKKILSNIIHSQIKEHSVYSGVVPEIASRLHTEWITYTVKKALKEAGVECADLDGIAVTARPGLLGSLMVGVCFAKALSASLSIPIIGVDHIKAHLFSSQLEFPLSYPYLGVLLSGGHTAIAVVKNYDDMEVLGTTLDDAIGEAFDKVAAHFGMGYPGGVMIDKLSSSGDSTAFSFPGVTTDRDQFPYDMSYSGLKSAVINQREKFIKKGDKDNLANIAASFQRTAVGILMKRVDKALKDTGIRRIAAGGGVAANSYFRSEMKKLEQRGYVVALPSMSLCTDNAAMIAGLGYMYLENGIHDDLYLKAESRVRAFRGN